MEVGDDENGPKLTQHNAKLRAAAPPAVRVISTHGIYITRLASGFVVHRCPSSMHHYVNIVASVGDPCSDGNTAEHEGARGSKTSEKS